MAIWPLASTAAGSVLQPQVEVEVSAPSELEVGGAEAGVEVVLTDTVAGAPVADGTVVTLTTSLGSITPTVGSAVAGKVAATLTTGTEAGLAVLLAETVEGAGEAMVVFDPGPPASLTLSAPSQSEVGIDTPITVSAEDEFGNAAPDGTEVHLGASVGSLSQSTVLMSDGQGAATVSSTLAASGELLAATGALTASRSILFNPGPPAVVLVAPEQLSIAVSSGKTPVAVEVRDRFDNLVAQPQSVRVTASSGTVFPESVATQGGVGVAEFRAGASTGDSELTATSGVMMGSAVVDVRPADLHLSLTAIGPHGAVPDGQINPGQQAVMRLTLDNRDLATAKGIVVAAVVPDALVVERVTSTGTLTPRASGPPGLIDEPPADHTRMYWDLSDIAHRQSVNIDIVGRIDPARPWTGFDSLFFRGAATHESPEASWGDLRRGAVVPVHATDLFTLLELDVSASVLRPGGRAVFDLAFGNNQRATRVRSVRITDTLPAGLTYDHWQPMVDTAGLAEAQPFTKESRELVWTFPGVFGLNAGMRIWFDIDDDVAPDAVLENRSDISSEVLDVRPSNNFDVRGAHLRGVNLAASITGPQGAAPGDDAVFAIRVANNAQSDTANGVRLRAVPPQGARVKSATPGVMDPGDGTLEWDVGVIGPGGRVTFEVVVEVPEDAPIGSMLRQRAEVWSAEVESYPDDNEATFELTVVPGAPDSVVVASSATQIEACIGAVAGIEAVVRDRHGNTVADGTSVVWTSSLGELDESESTTVGGVARASFQSRFGTGMARVTAQAGAAAGSVDVGVTPGPLRVLAVSAARQLVAQDTEVNITVNALDACSNRVPDGQRVTLSAERGTFRGGVSVTDGFTLDGRLSARLNVGSELGPLRVRASHDLSFGEVVIAVVEPQELPPEEPKPLYLPLTERPRR